MENTSIYGCQRASKEIQEKIFKFHVENMKPEELSKLLFLVRWSSSKKVRYKITVIYNYCELFTISYPVPNMDVIFAYLTGIFSDKKANEIRDYSHSLWID